MNPTVGLLVRTDNTWAPIALEDTLQDLYTALDCRTVTVVDLDHPNAAADMWCDDEALLTLAPTLNELATLLTVRFKTGHSEAIYGDAVILNRTPDGDAASLERNQYESITNTLRLWYLD